MDRLGFIPWLNAITIGLALILPSATVADVHYTAVLDGPSTGSTSPATGTALLTLNAAETEVAYTIEYSGMIGNETAAHIHNAPPGVLGPVFHDLEYGSPKIGIWPVGPFEVAELNAGRVNILIHSDQFPLAEIRGDVQFDSVAGVELPANANVPGDLVLRGNFPNPFNPLTEIAFSVGSSPQPTTLVVYDAAGRRVRTLLSQVLTPGEHRVSWDGTDDHGRRVPSGLYLYRLRNGADLISRKMLLLE